MHVGAAMLMLVVCWWMWRHYRMKTRCGYCGGEWLKHQDDCPYGGSGSRM